MTDFDDAFLSEEDLDLRELSDAELVAYWNLWLAQAQCSNDLDEGMYSHGVFESDPMVAHAGRGADTTVPSSPPTSSSSSADSGCR